MSCRVAMLDESANSTFSGECDQRRVLQVRPSRFSTARGPGIDRSAEQHQRIPGENAAAQSLFIGVESPHAQVDLARLYTRNDLPRWYVDQRDTHTGKVRLNGGDGLWQEGRGKERRSGNRDSAPLPFHQL